MLSKVFLILSVTLCASLSQATMIPTLQERFSNWVDTHAIKFINHAHEYGTFVTWVENDKHIETTNARNLTYSLGHNQFSGMTISEYKDFLGFDATQKPSGISSLRGAAPCRATAGGCTQAASVDWVTAGAVTPVKNQGQCGSCWSFSTTGALEGAYFIKNNDLESFSEQQLVSCDNRKNHGKDMGCNGGLMDSAFSWIEYNNGLCAEEDYIYTSGDTKSAGTCIQGCDNIVGSKIQSFVDVPPSSDADMMDALTKQPVSIAIEADQKDFQLYTSGVFTGACGTSLDHGVLTVGYGTMNGVDYYRVKNSWGTTWGDEGYIYLGRGSEFNNGAGQCGMLMQASYPVL